jgi:rhamnosyltransferase subunit B
MSRVVAVVALGSAGDVHPNVALALALRRRGNRVVLITSKYFEPLACRVGLEFVGLGTTEDYHAAVQDPDIWSPYRAFSVVARRLIVPNIAGIFEILSQWSKTEEVVVAASGLAFGARIAHEKLGLPLATVHLQPVMFRSLRRPPVFGFPDVLGFLPRFLRRPYLRAADRFVIDPHLAPAVNAFRAGLGLPPVRRLLDRWMHSPQLVIGLFPEWFAAPQPDWPPNVHLTGFPLYDERDSREPQPELDRFLDAGDAPVVFTGGSAMAQDAEFFRVSVEVCRASGRRGLLLTQFPEQLPARLPETVRHFHYVPFSKVLPRTAAFVHHGGIGTVAQGLAGGVPQLVVPLAHDQPDNAIRVRGLGVGEMLLPKHYHLKPVLRRLDDLLGSAAIRENCRRRSRDLSADRALERTCELIEGLGR